MPWVSPNLTAPGSIDWVAKGAVTPVKNQKHCGSCWAFSTTGSVEGAYYVASRKLVSLSEEELVQCDHSGDKGCKGGSMDNSFEFIKNSGGICSESSYPYTSGAGTRGTCKKGCSAAVTLAGFTDVPSGDEDELKKAVAQQPVSVAIEADQKAFQLYNGGVLDSAECGKKLDHGVLLVGYGTDGGKDYWKVKNSWGAFWGEQGYVRIARGKNMCGIANMASYPTGAKAVAPSPSPGPTPSPTPTPLPPTPSPTPSPTPTPSPPTPSTSHYEDPKDGCHSDEVRLSMQGVSGAVCAPTCGLFNRCPTDVPTGVIASPSCSLKDAASDRQYCALMCIPLSLDLQCGKNASCKSVQSGIGVCTYDDATDLTETRSVTFQLQGKSGEIVV